MQAVKQTPKHNSIFSMQMGLTQEVSNMLVSSILLMLAHVIIFMALAQHIVLIQSIKWMSKFKNLK